MTDFCQVLFIKKCIWKTTESTENLIFNLCSSDISVGAAIVSHPLMGGLTLCLPSLDGRGQGRVI
jgi:hypothetical protein